MLLPLSRIMLFRTSRVCLGAVMPAMQGFAVGDLAEGPVLRLRSPGGTVSPGLGPLRVAVEHDLFLQGIQRLRGGSFIWPSPIDGSASHLKAVLLPHEGAIFYHFRDRHGLDFLVLAADRHCHTIGLIFPMMQSASEPTISRISGISAILAAGSGTS